MALTRVPRVLACMATLLSLTGCPLVQKPFSYTVGDYNEKGPQQPAAITISDPQIYSREALVNDRFEEASLISDLLKRSKNQEFINRFQPQLARDLVGYSVASAQLEARFDPVAGRGVERAERLAELNQDIEELKLKRQRAEARQAYLEVLAGSDGSEGGNGTPSDTGNDQTDATEAAAQQETTGENPGDDSEGDDGETGGTGVAGVRDNLKRLAKLAGELQDELAERAENGGARRSTIPADPRDQFRDLQAYRAELRQALAEVNLDDLHDYGGNALYRLQFDATVLPGRHKDKLGVARLTFLPPEFDPDEIADLYYSWLAHATYRMNVPKQRSTGFDTAWRYGQLAAPGMFGLLRLYYVAPGENEKSFGHGPSPCALQEDSDPRPTSSPKRSPECEEFIDNTWDLCVLSPVSTTRKYPKACRSLLIAVHPGSLGPLSDLLENLGERFGLPDAGKGDDFFADIDTFFKEQGNDNRKSDGEGLRVPSDLLAAIPVPRDDKIRDFLERLVQRIRSSNKLNHQLCEAVWSYPQLSAALKQIDRGQLDKVTQRSLVLLEEKIDERIALARHILAIETNLPPVGRSTLCQFTAIVRGLGELVGNRLGAPEVFIRLVSRSLPDVLLDARRIHAWERTHVFDKVSRPTVVAPQGTLGPRSERAGSRVGAGFAYAYSVVPGELSQRLSSIARFANSLEFAVSAAATLPTKGLSGDLGIGYLRAAAGNAEAQERAPLVVGFAERRSLVERVAKGNDPYYFADYQAPQVGWVFVPPLRINAKDETIEPVHVTAYHRVAADLSVPGWWPSVNVDLETAWIGNWHDTSRVIRLDDEPGHGFHLERFKVPLPVNAADLDVLTNFLAKNTVGVFAQLLKIRHVEPYFISACANKVHLQIKGANIWRSSEVQLAGMPAEEVRIMPDMEGVAARFDMTKLYASHNLGASGLAVEQGVPLTVWSRNGFDTETVRLLGTRIPGKNGAPGACVARTALAAATRPGQPDIVSISPGEIDRCATDVTFGVKIAHMSDYADPTFLLGGKQGSLNPALPGKSGKSGVYLVDFSGGPFVKGEDTAALTFTAVSSGTVMNAPVRLQACKTKQPKSPPLAFVPARFAFVAKAVSKSTDIEGIVLLKLAAGNVPKTKLRIGLLTAAAGPRVDWHESTARPSLVPGREKENIYQAAFRISAAEKKRIALSNHSKLKLAVLDYAVEGSGPTVIPVKGPIVYYEPEDKAAVRLTSFDPSSYKGRLEFPKFWSVAYPGIGAADLKVHAMPGNIDLEVSPSKAKPNNSGVLNFEFEQSAKDKVTKARASGKVEIKLSFGGADQDLLPEITDGTGGALNLPKSP